MTEPVLVRSSLRTWDFILFLVLGSLLLIGATLLAALGLRVGACLLGVAGLVGVGGSLWGWHRRVTLRRWVTDTVHGFLVSDPAGDRQVADDEVVSMAINVKQNFVNGLPHSTTRRFVVWLVSEEQHPERLEMKNTIRTGKADPLADLINRLGDRLYAQALEDRRSGLAVFGDGWKLEGQELTFRMHKGQLACRLDEVVAVAPVDDQVCIWREGEEAAFAQVPADSANAYLLRRLLSEHVAQRPATSGPPPEGLGRIIFERRPSKGTVIAITLLAVVFLGPTLLVGVLALAKPALLLLALLFLALALLCIIGVLHYRRATFRCHQFGIYKEGLFGIRQLRYTEVEAFNYSAVRHFHNGVYTGTIFNLSFDPVPERQGNLIRYRVTLRGADQELDSLRDQVARMISARMARQQAAGEPVPWTPALRFVPEGIEYRAQGFLGRKDPLLIRWSEIYSFTIDKGYFYLWVKGQKKPVVQVSMAQRNFFPGYYLLASRYEKRPGGP